MGAQWWSSSQAAAALGVKQSTLYAYVSRGVVARHVQTHEGRRVSRFRRDEVLALAAERSRPRSGLLSALIESDVTALDADGTLTFRGVTVATCVGWGFEQTATHVLGDPCLVWPAAIDSGASRRPRATDTIRQVVLDLAGCDPDRTDIEADHCRRVALTAVEASTTALCRSSGTPAGAGTVASRLAAGWTGETRAARVIDVALAVMVDHELTASTLAARAAAGVRADPWMVLLTGLSAMSGENQARASRHALHLLRSWRDGEVSKQERVPGFRHKVYLGPDPRAEILLAEVADLAPDLGDEVEALCLHVARTAGAYPNIDLALAALTLAAGLPEDAGEVIFTLARIPGLMAHALEEYPHGLRLRPRALG